MHHKSRGIIFAIALLILVILQIWLQPIYAVPIRSRRMINETTDDSSATCILDGIIVPKAFPKCEQKPGCRAIQKTGYCCPEFQCECERDGKTYADGAKLDKIDPCKFCFCRGGEIVCSTVTCYNRDDCEPKFSPGTCCPTYDNCPLIDNKPFTTHVLNKVEFTSAEQPKQEIPNLNITIKETTKKEEIRIVDQKPIEQMQNKNNAENKQDGVFNLNENWNKETGESVSNLKTPINDDSKKNNETITEQITEVIIADKDGQSKTIQVNDTKWLQRGDNGEIPLKLDLLNSENSYENSSSSSFASTFDDQNYEPIASSSDDFIRIINSSPSTPINDFGMINNSDVVDQDNYNASIENYSLEEFMNEKNDFETNETAIEMDGNFSSSQQTPIINSDNEEQIVHNAETEYDVVTPIENPAYPIIKDEDLSNYQREVNESEDYPENNQWSKSAPALIDHIFESNPDDELNTNIRSSLDKIVAAESDFELNSEMIYENTSEKTEAIYSNFSVIPEGRAPGEPCLIPEWERNNTEFVNFFCNESISSEYDKANFNILKNNETDDAWQSSESIELDVGSGNGSGIVNGSDIVTRSDSDKDENDRALAQKVRNKEMKRRYDIQYMLDSILSANMD